MLEIKLDNFSYGSESILQNIYLVLKPAKTYGIVGLNGQGKTTMFKLIANMLKCESYSCNLKKEEISYVDTDLFLYPNLTGAEFLSVFPHENLNYDQLSLAELFGLPLDEFTQNYSTGMKKKLVLLSQFKLNKSIFLLDEPFNGLDLETNKLLEIIFKKLNEAGKTVIVSSHILDPLLKTCEEIFLLREKTIYKSYKSNSFNQIEQELFGDLITKAEKLKI